MKPNHRPGAFARLERSVKRYMNRRSQFAHELTGANISRTLAAELIIGSGIAAIVASLLYYLGIFG